MPEDRNIFSFVMDSHQKNNTGNEEKDRFVITVKSKAYARFVALDFKQTDAIFSDNYFDMPGGAARTVTVAKKALSSSRTAEELYGQLSLRSVFDI
ncbi:glycoside hydrolase family 2 protein [Paenibacillus sp. FSL R7-0297]|uniref:glycoside hydrolase family 2 protein n=1 Tax=unclassified Paenibacillus TaxID=185978 RepID=UPI0030FA03FF